MFDSINSVTSSGEIITGVSSYLIELSPAKIRKSLLKSYMALAYYVGIDPNICNIAISYLRSEAHECLLQEPPIFVFCEQVTKYNHITLIYSMGKFLFGGAHISGYPLTLLTEAYLGGKLHYESLVPSLLSTQYNGPSIMKAYMVNIREKQHDVLDMRCLLNSGAVNFNSRELEEGK